MATTGTKPAFSGWLWLLLPLAVAVLGVGIGRILARQRIRVDASGDGHYGSNRTGHVHEGTDLLVVPGEPVYSPIDGHYTRVVTPYDDDDRFSGVEVQGEGLDVEIMYVRPYGQLDVGDPVRRGDLVGYAQDIVERYGEPMLAHVHVEVRSLDGGHLLNPETVLELEA